MRKNDARKITADSNYVKKWRDSKSDKGKRVQRWTTFINFGKVAEEITKRRWIKEKTG